ncbi:MAG: hypothetical protein WCC64_12780, partial [Aliidongia sp.]
MMQQPENPLAGLTSSPNPAGGQSGGLQVAKLIAAIPQLIQQRKQRQIMDELQRVAAGNQQLDVYRKMVAADPKVLDQNPAIAQAIMKIGSTSGIKIPLMGADPNAPAGQGSP